MLSVIFHSCIFHPSPFLVVHHFPVLQITCHPKNALSRNLKNPLLPKISIGWVGCTNVTDRPTDRRQTTDGRPMTYSEHELEFTFAKNLSWFPVCNYIKIWNTWMIGHLLKYMCTKNYRNRLSSDTAIAESKRCSFLPHTVMWICCVAPASGRLMPNGDSGVCYRRRRYTAIAAAAVVLSMTSLTHLHRLLWGCIQVCLDNDETHLSRAAWKIMSLSLGCEKMEPVAGRVANRRQWILLRSLLCIRTFVYCRDS